MEADGGAVGVFGLELFASGFREGVSGEAVSGCGGRA